MVTWVTGHGTGVLPTGQPLAAGSPAPPDPRPAAFDLNGGAAAVTGDADRLRAWRAGAGVAEQQASVATGLRAGAEGAVTGLAAGVGY